MLTKMVAFGTDIGSILVRFWTPTWGTNQVIGINSAPRATQDPKWPPDPSEIEFWLIFDRFWLLLGGFLIDFWSNFGRLWSSFD